MYFFLRNALLFAAIGVVLVPFNLPGQGKVYLVVGSDTAVWNFPGGVDVSKYHGHFSPDLYTLPQDNAYKVMDPAFRNLFTDSYGQPLKLTWWMLVGSVYRQADNTDVPIKNLMPLYLMKQYHGDAIQQLGDELSLHYHTFFWSDYNQDGKYYWNQARTFHECRADFDFALAQSLLEEEVFPVSFRSGWHYMDNEWQSYLNELLPFSMHNDSPNVHTDTVEPLDNVYDWSIAPLAFVPFHPTTTNYQVPGDGIGWNVRSVKMPNVSQTMMNQMFAQAAGGTDQVASLWAHLPETAFPADIARIDSLAHVAASNYPTVQFRYCTAVEAMQRWLGATDQTPPQLGVAEDVQGEIVTLTITTSEPIFQPQPFVALKDICEQYKILACTPAGTNSWTITLPVPRSSLAKVGIAVTDLAGNLTTRILRYLPDDLYIDNLDPQYTEPSGAWQQTTNAAWGTDARVALLGESDVAQARWSLPISQSGRYYAYVQVPAISNAAGNLSFNFHAGNSIVQSAYFSAPLPPGQWVSLGSAFLDTTVTNYIDMLVSGAGQPGTFAVADVLKLSPLIPPGFIDNVRVEPFNTTANITWTTVAPAITLVEYGTDLNYGNYSATNSLPVTNHVMTVSGLTPGRTYYFQIDADAGGAQCTYQSYFAASNFVHLAPLFDVTNVWKFATTNLDGSTWQAPGYDDSAWPSGAALLWVDTRPNGPNPSVQPKNTQMPANPATQFPFITYYFRTHFTFTDTLPGTSLTFSNYIDDGAVFYLNGTEIYRQNMAAAPTVISNSTLAAASNCSGDATCPVLFTVSGDAITNLLLGDNVLAVEVHNLSAKSPDITFGSGLYRAGPYTPPPRLEILRSGAVVTIYWNGSGFTLQEASQLAAPAINWLDTLGPVTASPFTITDIPAAPFNRFYRLHSK